MKIAFLPVIYMALTSDPTMKNPAPTTDASPQRMATVRPFALPKEGSPRTTSLEARAKDMNGLFETGAPLSKDELEDIVHSIQNIYSTDATTAADAAVDFDKLRDTLSQIAHISHKDWTVTEANSQKLGHVLLKDGMANPAARQMLERILVEGNWDGAAEHAKVFHNKDDKDHHPWAVLVTGVNGIRKTTSIYQSWWPELLQEALIAPPSSTSINSNGKRKTPDEFPLDNLPCGSNSFFRQLDHMIATLCNEDFKALYYLAEQELQTQEEPANPSAELVKKYSDLKAAIFSRYRTLSELLGALLLKEAQTLNSNCMMETSGRDVAMFHYVDHFFPKEGYNKLALHFTINDLSQAQESVDRRMVHEIKEGIQAVHNKDNFDVIYANAGGPYGSEVLPGVQEASDSVWNNVVLKGEEVGQDWYKATIAITAHAAKPWTAQAVRPDGSLGTVFTFSRKEEEA